MTNCRQDEENSIRSRRKWEDTLLNTRTGIFLILNGLAMKDGLPSLKLSIGIAFVNCLWVLSSLQSHKTIVELTKSEPSSGQKIVGKALGMKFQHHQLRPTTIIGRWLPILVYVGLLVHIGGFVRGIWLLVVIGAIFFPFGILLILRMTKGKSITY